MSAHRAQNSQTSNDEANSDIIKALNTELAQKSQALRQAKNDLENLLSSSDIATIFLDHNYRIQRFTHKSAELFNLIESDIGRPLIEVSPKLADPSFIEDSQAVLIELDVSQREIKHEDGRWFSRRILPYRTQANEIQGLALTYFDITELKEAQFQAKESEYSWRRLLEDAEMLVALFEGPGHRYTFTNRLHREFSSRVQLNRPLNQKYVY